MTATKKRTAKKKAEPPRLFTERDMQLRAAIDAAILGVPPLGSDQ